LPDKLVIFDDNDEPQDMRNELVYGYFFQMLDIKGVAWEWVFAAKKGQHYSHQTANLMGYEWVWRVDDDAIPEPNVLQTLMMHTGSKIGAVGGSVLTPPAIKANGATGFIELINDEPNIQWGMIDKPTFVQHLHCTFLYRAGVHDYNLGLSRVAHREETLFTYGLYQKGYGIVVAPNAITWHLKNPKGGIRSETNQALYERDERIFENFMELKNHTIVVLNGGLGDHIVFSKVLPKIRNPIVFTCYPEVVEGLSIAEAEYKFGNLDQWNIYKKMDQWKWQGSLESAYEKMYL
jgi:hypothetical protein